jgi:RNA polymerase sigma factor (TIGR02999 family)
MASPPDKRVTHLLESAGRGDPGASEELLPLVYDALRRLARARMAKVPPGNTLQPTALVHEAYLRLLGSGSPSWNGRGHFFAAAAEAMRRILVEQARRKATRRAGGGRKREDVDDVEIPIAPPSDDLLALDEALRKLEQDDPRKGRIVLLRHFAGLNREETAEVLGISVRTVDREWAYILARLHRDMTRDEAGDPPQ